MHGSGSRFPVQPNHHADESHVSNEAFINTERDSGPKYAKETTACLFLGRISAGMPSIVDTKEA